MAKRREDRVKTVERTIQFYRAKYRTEPDRQCDWPEALQALSDVKYPSRYVGEPGEDYGLLGWADDAAAGRFRVAAVRRNNLPQVEQGGALTDLAIADDQGLAEVVHLAAFTPTIVGAVFNYHGPRASRIARYLGKVLPAHFDGLDLQPLLRRDATDRLDRIDKLTYVEMSVHDHAVSKVMGTMREAFKELQRSGASRYYLQLSSGPDRRRSLAVDLLRSIRSFARSADLPESASVFKVRGSVDGRIEMVDLLSDDLLYRTRIKLNTNRSRALDDTSAYAGIADAYATLKGQLAEAPSVSLNEPTE